MSDHAQITGYAAVFDSLSEDLGGFREIIRPGAFHNALTQHDDVRGLVNHEVGQLLGRTSSGTMRLREGKRGLRYTIDDPETTASRDVIKQIARGDMSGSSFSFLLREGPDDADLWRLDGDDMMIREVFDVRLFDVGPVTFPAYLKTDTDATTDLDRDLVFKLHAAAEFEKYVASA